jgi:signal transduction histidine kinase
MSTHCPEPYSPSENDLRLLDLYARLAADFIERIRADEALRESQARLGDENRHKDEYLAMLGHELRNPLAALRSAADVISVCKPTDARIRDANGVLDRQLGHVSRIIDGLLEVSRIVRGRIDLRREVLDLRRIVGNVLDEQAADIAAHGLELASEEPAEPLWVDADEIRLVQVVDNLVGNAVKFTPAPGTIGVRTERAEGRAVLRVRDSGIGIRREVLDRIFEAFQQGPQDVARSEGGLGLGLPLARGLVELHGGTIEADSQGQGTGAEFVVRLPLASPPVDWLLPQQGNTNDEDT